MISTSTDDGTPIRCDVCGNTSLVNVSRPSGESVCPVCGTFLWVDALVEITSQHAFVPDICIRQLNSTKRDAAIREVTSVLAADRDWTASQLEQFIAAVLKREELGSTGIGGGYAVPHASCDWIASSTSVLAFAPQAIDFGSLDGQPVHTIILLASAASKRGDHLRLVERVCRAIRFGRQAIT